MAPEAHEDVQYILYDLASKDGNHCWSHNPWKSRLILNFKGLNYRTVFLEYPDVAPTLKALGLPPNPEATPYTIPAITETKSGTHYMDSLKIVEVLEAAHPSPSLHLDSPVLKRMKELLPIATLGPIFFPLIPVNLLNPPSKAYFDETRAKRFGMPLEEMSKTQGGDKAWKASKSTLDQVEALTEQHDGPFLEGKSPTYADFMLAAFIQMLAKGAPELHQKITQNYPGTIGVWKSCKPWLERDDH